MEGVWLEQAIFAEANTILVSLVGSIKWGKVEIRRCGRNIAVLPAGIEQIWLATSVALTLCRNESLVGRRAHRG